MADQEVSTHFDLSASLGNGLFQLSADLGDITEADAVALAKCANGLGSFTNVTLMKSVFDVTRSVANLAVDPVVFE